jgi:hypothetical protein
MGGDTMSGTSTVRYYDGVVSSQTCREIIDGFERSGELIHQSELNNRVNTSGRDSYQIQLSEGRLAEIFGDRALSIHQEVLGAIRSTVELYDRDLGGMISRLVPWDFSQVDILKYNKESGIYRTHIDTDGREGMERFFSVVLYLNTVEIGGETHFPLQDKDIRPVEGRLALFPSNYAFPHKACVPISGDKYVIVAWAKGMHNLT